MVEAVALRRVSDRRTLVDEKFKKLKQQQCPKGFQCNNVLNNKYGGYKTPICWSNNYKTIHNLRQKAEACLYVVLEWKESKEGGRRKGHAKKKNSEQNRSRLDRGALVATSSLASTRGTSHWHASWPRQFIAGSRLTAVENSEAFVLRLQLPVPSLYNMQQSSLGPIKFHKRLAFYREKGEKSCASWSLLSIDAY